MDFTHQCIRSFSNHLPGIISALKELEELNLIETIKAKSEVIGAINYLETSQCIIMSSIWFKILAAIDIVNEVIQARSSTIDIEIQNLNNLITDLKTLRDNWSSIVQEVKLVACSMNIDAVFPSFRKKKRTIFDVFFTIIDSVLQGLLKRYNAANNIYKMFGFLWCYLELEDQEIRIACANSVEFYKNDIIQDDFQNEVINLKGIHTVNFGPTALGPLELLNVISNMKLDSLFQNVCIVLRIFVTLSVTVASAERSFSKLKLIKNFLRNAMSQERLNDLAILSIENELARQANFDELIDTFASRKARKAI